MRKLLPTGVLGLVGLVTVGLISLQSPATSSAADDAAKREDQAPELVLVDDDDADSNDSNDTSGFTGFSRATGDNTRSNFTKVSRDRDWSRSDKTRDKTYDGPGGKKRDWSGGHTNDRSRNDSR